LEERKEVKIYTYRDHVPQLSIEDETRLILLWKDAWEKIGYEPIVLNEWVARSNKLFPVVNDIVSKLPSINPETYDRACYLRWLAMAEVGGGIMADYDVFPYDRWKPHARKHLPDQLHGYQKHVPSLVQGSKKAFLNVLNAFLHYEVTERDVENGKPHVSDMLILLNAKVPMIQTHEVKNYGEEGWETSKLTHFSTSSMSPAKLPRWKFVPQLRTPLT
jgi:hypothetical protein